MKPSTPFLRMTDHALSRSQQRGISARTITTVIDYADIRPWVGSGCRSHMISRRRLSELPNEVLSPSEKEKVAGVAVVIDPADRVVVTVLHADSRCAARYRRSFRSRSWAKEAA
jgi:hypothetical protein